MYLRKVCDVDAVDVHVSHYVSHCGAQTSRRLMLRMYIPISFSKLSVQCNLFWTKIVLLYNCTLNFCFNLFRNRTLDLTMDLF